MRLNLRELAVLLGLAAVFCVAFLIEPDWNVTEAHLLCDGEPMQVFDSMSACHVRLRPGCTCLRPENPWVYVFWLAVLASLGVAASILLRSNVLPAAVLLSLTLAAAGVFAIFLLSLGESFEEEAWAYAPLVIGMCVSIIVGGVFGVARAIRHWISTRRAAT